MTNSIDNPASAPTTPTAPSRRALLAGAVGGLGALAASAIGRPQIAQAHDVEDVLLGGGNSANTTTLITNNADNGAYVIEASGISGVGVFGHCTSGSGLRGDSTSGSGVIAFSNSGAAVSGTSQTWSGIFGYVPGGANTRGVTGVAYGDGTGVMGQSSTAPLSRTAKAKTGVYGYAGQDSGSRGVWGETKAGHAIHGNATTGYAGYFAGKVFTTAFHELQEISAPIAPGANKARLFVRDNGSGKSQLCVRFSSGAIQVVVTQP
jgi:hypothetical protein